MESTVTKKDLARRAAERVSANAELAYELVGAVIEEIQLAVEKGEKVTIAGFGSFEGRDKAAQVVRNPQNNKPVEVPARRVPAFKVSGKFRDRIIAAAKTEEI